MDFPLRHLPAISSIKAHKRVQLPREQFVQGKHGHDSQHFSSGRMHKTQVDSSFVEQ